MTHSKKPRAQPEFSFDDGTQPEPEAITRADEEESVPIYKAGGPLQELMDSNFLQYASYVICERAIPALSDGLKPVQRRILHALHEKDDGRFVKVASIVGHAMQYHPHGDQSIAAALVALTNRGYLIEGQGNFGNIFTGDPAAATRYIECRLTDLARNELFNPDLTKYVPSYDGRNKEPVAFPSKIPLLLMLGAEGIAVGLATHILPYNFPELLEAQIAILKKKPFKVLPDFPQGGLMDTSGYVDGNGTIRVRAGIEQRDEHTLVITELPPGTTTDSLTSSIEDAIRKKKVRVKSITDFTSERVEIELTLASDAKPERAIKALYAFTSCETTVTGNLVLIHKGRPREMTVSEVLKALTAQLVGILEAELNLRRRNLLEELHAKTLIQIFVENRIYKLIEECKTYEAVQQAVLDGLAPFKDRLRREVTKDDVEVLLGVRIRRISLFDINKNKKDIDGILKEIAKVEHNLKDVKRYAVLYLQGLLRTYADQYPRRTRAQTFANVEVRKLTSTELQISVDAEKGYLGHEMQGEPLLQCSSLDKLVVVWDDGRYRVMPPPEKFFVGDNMLYCAVFDRDHVMTVIYALDDFTYMKRFTLGGTIMNRDYRCAAEGAKVLLFDPDDPQEVYVKYKPAKNQRIHQQIFQPSDIPVKGARARGNQMTAKAVARIATKKPRWWKDGDSPRGVMV